MQSIRAPSTVITCTVMKADFHHRNLISHLHRARRAFRKPGPTVLERGSYPVYGRHGANAGDQRQPVP